MTYLSEHFSRGEFACRCGCGADHVLPSLVDALEDLRIAVGDRSIRILSGVRCSAHNAKVGGAQDSQHLVGRAADIFADGVPLAQLYRAATTIREFNAGGIGLYPDGRWLHVDTRLGGRSRWGRLAGKNVDLTTAWVALGTMSKAPG